MYGIAKVEVALVGSRTFACLSLDLLSVECINPCRRMGLMPFCPSDPHLNLLGEAIPQISAPKSRAFSQLCAVVSVKDHCYCAGEVVADGDVITGSKLWSFADCFV